jgi:hypothetical protein
MTSPIVWDCHQGMQSFFYFGYRRLLICKNVREMKNYNYTDIFVRFFIPTWFLIIQMNYHNDTYYGIHPKASPNSFGVL